jgi:hypothetical protein
MTYSVHQHWDPLKVCAVGRSYPPEFYSFIANSRVRDVMERIAVETEEDYQKLIKVLESFNVEIVRPSVIKDFSSCYYNDRYLSPSMMIPRDYTVMVGDKFFMWSPKIAQQWDSIKGDTWPELSPTSYEKFNELPQWVKEELINKFNITHFSQLRVNDIRPLDSIEAIVNAQGNEIRYDPWFNGATLTRVGKDLYFGTDHASEDISKIKARAQELFPEYRCHIINTGGHSDGTYCPVKPGLIVSLEDIPTYAETFPGWEVIYLPGQSWTKVEPFLDLKEKNRGKWWVPGEELNDDFTNFVESWLSHWVGYVEETVFDVNMLVVNEKNVICNNYNEQVFAAFDRHGITPHVVNFRHRYFWDGGLHCITSDLHREGAIKDYFPERG